VSVVLPKPIAAAAPHVEEEKLSKPEREYRDLLRGRLARGEILWFAIHPISLKLAKGNSYLPDFMVVRLDGVIEIVEVKCSNGFKGTRFNGGSSGSGGKSRAKFLDSVEAFPLFRFVLAIAKLKRDGGGFEETTHLPRFGYGSGVSEVVIDSFGIRSGSPQVE